VRQQLGDRQHDRDRGDRRARAVEHDRRRRKRRQHDEIDELDGDPGRIAGDTDDEHEDRLASRLEELLLRWRIGPELE
jgi:hypothetical protein